MKRHEVKQACSFVLWWAAYKESNFVEFVIPRMAWPGRSIRPELHEAGLASLRIALHFG